MSTTDPTTPTSSLGASPSDDRLLAAGDSPATTPTSTSTADDGARTGRARTGTMVWGLVLLLIGVSVAAVGAGATLDMQAVLIGLLLVSGTGLLVGSIIAARRRT